MSLSMNNNSNSAENTSMSNSKQTIMYMLSFLKSKTSEASYFNKADVTEFLHWFHKLEKYHEMRDENLIEMLLNYYKYKKCSCMRTQKNFVKKNWADLKCQFCTVFEKWNFY